MIGNNYYLHDNLGDHPSCDKTLFLGQRLVVVGRKLHLMVKGQRRGGCWKMVKQMASKRRGGQPLWSLTIGQPDHKIPAFLRVPL